MQILVTGSSGKLGVAAVAALRNAGHAVTGLDIKGKVEGCALTIGCDCTDFGQVISAMSGGDMVPKPEAVLHLGGLPRPGLTPDEVTFRTNLLSTYNVFKAAAQVGIRRIVWSASETIYGVPFGPAPKFVPLDESHPELPQSSYALTKKLAETVADELVQWYPGLSIVSLRLSNVLNEDDYLTPDEMEKELLFRRGNLWSYVDARDAAEACRLALEADLPGHERLLIGAADTLANHPTADLLKKHFPDVPERRDLSTYQSLQSTARAAELIGYRARYSWRKP